MEATPRGSTSGFTSIRADSGILTNSAARGWWLFSAPLDLAAFLGSATAALTLLAIGWKLGLLVRDTPDWTWVAAVLLIDVAHVYATAFRVYFDPNELRRRPWVYLLTPLLAFLIGLALYSRGELLFWRTLAYVAVFHFVRQQYGWVALYRARVGERDRTGWWIDSAAIYLATIYPLVYWHAHLPRNFWWFLDHDFVAIPTLVERGLAPIYWAALVIYGSRSLIRGVSYGFLNPGKDIVVATTAVCWYAGIVLFNSDYAFTVTNVVIHGVPYLVLIYWYATRNAEPSAARSRGRLLVPFLATVWLLAYVEELVWDRSVWHERSWLFGSAWAPGRLQAVLVPLLAVPQITHYILDGFIWRRRSNPELTRLNSSSS